MKYYMGTLSDWLRILSVGAFWAGAMAWTFKSRDPLTNPRTGRILYGLEWIFAGLLFGILMTFHWRQVIHPPLVLILVPALIGMLVPGLLIRSKKRKSIGVAEQNPLAIPTSLSLIVDESLFHS